MSKKVKYIISILVLVLLVGTLGYFMARNRYYNSVARQGCLDESSYKDGIFDFGDVAVEIAARGGDSGSWMKDELYDSAGNVIHEQCVGTIYECVVINKSKNVISDWKIKIPINEAMWINNSWNSKLEIHQNVNSDEKVMAVDLAEYSEYDISLDYYVDHTGPMIPLYEGDYFIYMPEVEVGEKPIAPSATGDISDSSARFGYIMYIPNQNQYYVADFSGGEIEYFMYENPVKQTWFIILSVLIFAWILCFIIWIAVKVKTRKIILQQKKQKEHDEKIIRQTMQLVINLIESKDVNTKGHSIRVAEISTQISKTMGFAQEESEQVYYIGLMHDCGKINIPDSILKNPGRLSNEEYEEMKKHTVYGANALKDFSSIKDIDVGAKYHHERYDGKGYPSGLAGEDIPLVARIIGVADAFDAMNSNRCYRNRLTKEIIIKELEENKGKQFDPQVVEVLLDLIEKDIVKPGVE